MDADGRGKASGFGLRTLGKSCLTAKNAARRNRSQIGKRERAETNKTGKFAHEWHESHEKGQGGWNRLVNGSRTIAFFCLLDAAIVVGEPAENFGGFQGASSTMRKAKG